MHFVNSGNAFCVLKKCSLCIGAKQGQCIAMEAKEYIFQTEEDPINLISLVHTTDIGNTKSCCCVSNVLNMIKTTFSSEFSLQFYFFSSNIWSFG